MAVPPPQKEKQHNTNTTINKKAMTRSSPTPWLMEMTKPKEPVPANLIVQQHQGEALADKEMQEQGGDN